MVVRQLPGDADQTAGSKHEAQVYQSFRDVAKRMRAPKTGVPRRSLALGCAASVR